MSIILNGTTGITTPDVTSDGSLKIDASAPDDSLVVDASGNVGIGAISPSSYGKLVSLGGDNATLFAAVSSTNMLRVQGYNSTYLGTVLEAVNLAQSANTPMFVNGSELKFGISGTERARIDSDGLKFNGDTSSANALDDYEEGTWTPTLSSTGTAPTVSSYTTRAGTYTKVGNIVTVECLIRATLSAVGTGTPTLTGFPFGANAYPGAAFGIVNILSGGIPATAYPYITSSTLILEGCTYQISGNNYLTFTTTYRTS